jgi:RNA polymerase sigma-70 factor (ECF subfamily)
MPSGRPQPVPPIAHAQLWDRHRDSVRAVLWRLLGPGGDIDDCVNEVFARLFERLPTLRRPASLPAFVTGIARRVAFAERRRRRNERLRTVHDPHAEIADPRWPAAMHYIGATSALLRRLPDGPRRLFVPWLSG